MTTLTTGFTRAGATVLWISGRQVDEFRVPRAAAYLFHIVSNHPFVDGNQRTGTVAALTFLDLNGYWFDDKGGKDLDDALESLVLSVACGETGKDEIAAFFRKHCPPSQ
jgi:death-on-curing protein